MFAPPHVARVVSSGFDNAFESVGQKNAFAQASGGLGQECPCASAPNSDFQDVTFDAPRLLCQATQLETAVEIDKGIARACS